MGLGPKRKAGTTPGSAAGTGWATAELRLRAAEDAGPIDLVGEAAAAVLELAETVQIVHGDIAGELGVYAVEGKAGEVAGDQLGLLLFGGAEGFVEHPGEPA